MTTNKPEVVGYIDEQEFSQRVGHAPFLHPTPNRGYTVPLIRLSDHEALQAECEQLRKDAERYRWLRLGAHEDSDLERWEHIGYVCGVSVCTAYGFQQTLDAEALDAAIDAAMAGNKP